MAFDGKTKSHAFFIPCIFNCVSIFKLDDLSFNSGWFLHHSSANQILIELKSVLTDMTFSSRYSTYQGNLSLEKIIS